MPEEESVGEDRRTDEQEETAEEQAGLEGDEPEEAFELRVGWEETFLGAEDFGGDGEDGDVGSDEE